MGLWDTRFKVRGNMKKAVLTASILGVALSLVVGCGSNVGTAPSRYAQTVVSEPGFNVSPIAMTGAIEVVLVDGYSTMATAADVTAIKVTVVPKSGAPVTKTVTKGQNAVIDGLPVGKASLTIDALDVSNNLLGTVSKPDVDVVGGQTTSVKLSLKLNPTIVAPKTGGLAVEVTLIDGDVIEATPAPTTAPTATPTTAPTPTPTPTPTAPPTASGLSDGFEAGFGNWAATFEKASYSSAGTASSNWNVAAAAAKAGSFGASAGNASGQVMEPGYYRMTLAGTVNTGSMTNPKIDFDFSKFTSRYYFKSGSFKVETSTDNGATWSQAWAAEADQAGWAHVSADLPHSGNLKVRFSFMYDYFLGVDAFGAPSVDNVSIADAK